MSLTILPEGSTVRDISLNLKHLTCKTTPEPNFVPCPQPEISLDSVVARRYPGNSAVASRLKYFAAPWPSVTSDHWVLQVVREGPSIDFIFEPIQKLLPPQIAMSFEMLAFCDAEMHELLSKRAISEVMDGSSGTVCSFFCVKKKQAGQFRPIVNLKPLNRFIKYQHFEMENLETVRFLVRKDDWLAKVDLKDAYFTVAVNQAHYKFLRFRWRERTYEFNCMAFGLAPAPRVFAKILKVVMAVLRRCGIRLVIYLDGILVLNESRQGLLKNLSTVTGLFQSLGFLVNWKKSVVIPTQVLKYLGLVVNSIDISFSLPGSKSAAVKKM